MDLNLWKTLFDNNFDYDQYLYHYTSVEKAIKIINSNELWFSRISKTNDTTESKLRIKFKDSFTGKNILPDERTKAVSEYLSRTSDCVRIICFSVDSKLKNEDLKDAEELHLNHAKDKYFDISGRGFALPRMWAQYASNHEGVCFIVNKRLFDEQLSQLAYCKSGKVKYNSFFTSYTIYELELQHLYNRCVQFTNGMLSFIDLINSDSSFMNYNYFEKQRDWENEKEYRYVTLVDSTRSNFDVKIGNLFGYVEGIVIGEKIDIAFENVMRMLVKDKCSVKKIHFSTNMCYVE